MYTVRQGAQRTLRPPPAAQGTQCREEGGERDTGAFTVASSQAGKNQGLEPVRAARGAADQGITGETGNATSQVALTGLPSVRAEAGPRACRGLW